MGSDLSISTISRARKCQNKRQALQSAYIFVQLIFRSELLYAHAHHVTYSLIHSLFFIYFKSLIIGPLHILFLSFSIIVTHPFQGVKHPFIRAARNIHLEYLFNRVVRISFLFSSITLFPCIWISFRNVFIEFSYIRALRNVHL